MLLILLSDPGHQWVVVGLVHLRLKVLHNFYVSLNLTFPEGVLQELTGLSLLLTLLLQHIFQEISIPLHEALGIFEPVFQLFFTVPLDSLE